jgi:formate dehydrogenase major subunit
MHVRNGQVTRLEGDPDHPVNRGRLCPKVTAGSPLPGAARRVTKPLYRPPGAAGWQEISWDEAIARIAAKIKAVRDATWLQAVNRTDSIACLGSGHLTNEECYLLSKFIRLLGSNYIENQARV